MVDATLPVRRLRPAPLRNNRGNRFHALNHASHDWPNRVTSQRV